MAHDPDKFWYAQVYSALCDCGHVLKAQLHRYFTSDDSDSINVPDPDPDMDQFIEPNRT
jgi:hypothetical protein